MSTAPAIETMRAKARTQDTETLIEAVGLIGGTHTISDESKLARAVMLDVIEEREGAELVEELMDALELPLGLDNPGQLSEPFCACGRVVSNCDHSRRGCARSEARRRARSGR
jgi:hypothetical protein